MNENLQKAINESLHLRKSMKEKKQAIVKRWEGTGLLNGLEVAGNPERTEIRKLNMAQLLENQIDGVRRSKEGSIPQILLEAPSNITQTTADKEAWSNVAFPLVRRAFADTFAEELVAVQTMDMPTSYIFYLDYTYGTTKPDNYGIYATGSGLYRNTESLYGDWTASGVPTSGSGPSGHWYGGPDYSYTRNYYSASAVGYSTANISWADVEYDVDLSASVVAGASGALQKVMIPATYLKGADTTQPEAILLTSGSAGVASPTGAICAQYRRFSKYVADGVGCSGGLASFVFIVSASHGAGVAGVALAQGITAGTCTASLSVVEYLVTGSQTNRGDFESGHTGVGAIPQIKIKITREEVTAQTRRLKTTWSEEESQDMEAYQGISMENEFVDIMTKVITQEIDLHVLAQLRKAAIDKMYWSRMISHYLNKFNGAVSSDATGTYYGTQKEWYQTLFERILDLSNLMMKRTLLGGATHLVVSPEVSTILESAGLLGAVSGGGTDSKLPQTYTSGVAEFVGSLRSLWKVYKSAYVPSNEILLVRRGTSWLETGYVLAPYVPITFTDTLVDPADFSMVKGAVTRYATKVVKPEFFALLEVKHLNVY